MSNMSVARLALLCFFVLAVKGVAFRNKRNMYPERRWPKDSDTGLVHILWTMNCLETSRSDEKGCEKAKTAAYNAAKTLAKNTCIRLEYTPNPPTDYTDYIELVTDYGCKSSVGRKGGKQRLSLAPWCQDTISAIHEFMHALGFHHEQVRPDRDNYVKINWENISLRTNTFNDFEKADDSTTLGSPYDYYSIMHYSRYGKPNGGDTITTKDPSKQDVIGHKAETRGPSQLDYAKINTLYKCNTTCQYFYNNCKEGLKRCRINYRNCMDYWENY